MPEEVRFFLRLSAYGVLIGVVYWFVSYEVAGTVLLLAFGAAAGFATVLLLRDARRRGAVRGRFLDWIGLTDASVDGPFLSEPNQVPTRSVAPVEFGLGLAIIALGLTFGSWLIALGLVPLAIGAWAWLTETMADYRVNAAIDDVVTEDVSTG